MWLKKYRGCMRFLLPTASISFQNAVVKANLRQTQYTVTIPSRTFANKEDDCKKMVDPKRVLNYEEMLKVIHEPQKVIIDVREPEEVNSTGKIPSSINIPLDEVHKTLACMSHEEFRCHYQREKPSSSDELIFYCQSGRRSTEALNKALQLGFKNSKTYLGSWSDWSSRCK